MPSSSDEIRHCLSIARREKQRAEERGDLDEEVESSSVIKSLEADLVVAESRERGSLGTLRFIESAGFNEASGLNLTRLWPGPQEGGWGSP
jgi:uncharacterized Fe-S cluster-containing protein